MVNDPLTRYMFCSPGEGGAAVSSPVRPPPDDSADGRSLARDQSPHPPVRLLRGVQSGDPGHGHPTSVSADAAAAAFEQAGIGPSDVDVAQLQDTESGAEIMHMAECGFCEHGEQESHDRGR